MESNGKDDDSKDKKSKSKDGDNDDNNNTIEMSESEKLKYRKFLKDDSEFLGWKKTAAKILKEESE